MPKGTKVTRADNPPFTDFWGRPFMRKEVQRVLREGRKFNLKQPYLAAYIFHAFDAARAFSEEPQGRWDAASRFLGAFQWSQNAWFFRLCVAISDANDHLTDREKKLVAVTHFPSESLKEAAVDVGIYFPDVKHADKITQQSLSNIMASERKRRAGIIREWKSWHAGFFSPMPPSELWAAVDSGRA